MIDKFIERTDDLEEAIDRLVSSSEYVYDADLHNYIISETSELVRDVVNSEMNNESKMLVIELIREILASAIEEILSTFSKEKQ